MSQKFYWTWRKLLKVLIDLIHHAIVVVVVPHIHDRKNTTIIMLRKKQIKNFQKKKLDLKDRKIQQLVNKEAKEEKL
jgi:hypothetical protein